MMVQVQVIVAGFNRALSTTESSINQMVVAPLRKLDPLLLVTYVLGQSKQRVRSYRSGEDGFAERISTVPKVADCLHVIEQEAIDSEMSNRLAKLLAQYQSKTRIEEEIITNVLRFLYILRSASEFVDPSKDFVFFTRPDLLWHDPLQVEELINGSWKSPRNFRGVAVANWGGGPNPNDRYGLISSDAVRAYFLREKHLERYIATGVGFSAEGFLGYALAHHFVAPVIPSRASRVRVGGRVKNEKFRPTEISGTRAGLLLQKWAPWDSNPRPTD